MDQLIIEELPYSVDSAPLFAQFLDLKQPVYLDSAAPYSSRGRYDIFSAEPVAIPEYTPAENTRQKNTKPPQSNYFDDIKQALDTLTPRINNDYHLPFTGGALGYFGYDVGRQLENLPNSTNKDLALPDAAVGIYSWAVIIDHRQQRSILIAHPQITPGLLKDVRLRLKAASASTQHFRLTSNIKANMTRQEYGEAFKHIQNYIHAGDCYQINLAQRFSAEYEGSPWAAYLALRATAAAPFSAYMQLEEGSILSVSPERFLHAANQRVTTSPIKGTIGRGDDRKTDDKLAHQLLNSTKDRAENLMIVDLLRNDLGKTCLPGSIHVDELFELQSFETVHHLVSTISGQLREGIDSTELLASCFPGGSITGAPKIRAMEIIEQLEYHRRSAYCGSIGYISCDGQMDTNIAIRTMVCKNSTIHCWAGGGIVADSDCDSEYQECHTKVGKLLAALETCG